MHICVHIEACGKWLRRFSKHCVCVCVVVVDVVVVRAAIPKGSPGLEWEGSYLV